MFSFHEIDLRSLSVHWVGNKSRDEGVRKSRRLSDLSEAGLKRVMLKYFLSSFTSEETFHFSNDIGMELNELFFLVGKVFDKPSSLVNIGNQIAELLYSKSGHPKIKNGEVFVAYFSGAIIGGEVVDGIGIFKSESKEKFIKIEFTDEGSVLSYDQGTPVEKLDKGAFIFNVDRELGYQVLVVDNTNQSHEAAYWKESFLSVSPTDDDYFRTSEILKLTNQYLLNSSLHGVDLSRFEQLDYLGRSMDYFGDREQFDKDEYIGEIFDRPEIRHSFHDFDRKYSEEHGTSRLDRFEISTSAVRKQARLFKSILKLDKNFHIYIHGNRDMIERGVDENGRKYYKIYYEVEH